MTGKVALTDMCSNLSKTLSHPILGCNCISHQLLLVMVLSGTAQKWSLKQKMISKETQKAISKLEKVEIACIKINVKKQHLVTSFIVYDHLFKTVIKNARKSSFFNTICGQILAIEDCFTANFNNQ